MGRIKLGRTGLVVEKQGFGCLPIQWSCSTGPMTGG